MKIVTKSILCQRFGFFRKSFALPDRPDIEEICPQKIPCDFDFNKITWDFEFDYKLAIFDFNGLIWLFLNGFSALTAAVRGGSESVKSQWENNAALIGLKACLDEFLP